MPELWRHRHRRHGKPLAVALPVLPQSLLREERVTDGGIAAAAPRLGGRRLALRHADEGMHHADVAECPLSSPVQF